MKRILLPFFVCAFALTSAQKKQQTSIEVYYPGPDVEWKKKTPAEAGLNADKLKEAITYCISQETTNPRSMEQSHYQTFGREPFGTGIGPFKDRGDVSGVILHKGYIVAEWGDPFRADMTHSVTKSFLSSVIGLAVDKGLIRSVNDTVWKYVPPILPYNNVIIADKASNLGEPQLLTPFETPHNRKITWDHLLRQVSDWEGILWGKPEWADRPGPKPAEWTTRQGDLLYRSRPRVVLVRVVCARGREGGRHGVAFGSSDPAHRNRQGPGAPRGLPERWRSGLRLFVVRADGRPADRETRAVFRQDDLDFRVDHEASDRVASPERLCPDRSGRCRPLAF